jgi:hypothetical protein
LQSLSNQLHDFNVGMGPDVGTVPGGNNFGTRVFWTAVVPDGDVLINPLTGTVQMHVDNLAALDYPEGFASGSLGPNWQTAYVPARVSFDIVWSRSIDRRVTVRDETDQFGGTFAENHDATVSWSARSTSGFRFDSLSGDLSTSTPGTPDITTTYFFAEVGFERNGIFFPLGVHSFGDSPASFILSPRLTPFPTSTFGGSTSPATPVTPTSDAWLTVWTAPQIGGVHDLHSDPANGSFQVDHRIWADSASDLLGDGLVNDLVAQGILGSPSGR